MKSSILPVRRERFGCASTHPQVAGATRLLIVIVIILIIVIVVVTGPFDYKSKWIAEV